MDDAKSVQPQSAPPSNHHPTESVNNTLSRTVWVSTGLIVAAILLAMFGVMSDAWAVQEESETIDLFGTEITTKVESETGLDDF